MMIDRTASRIDERDAIISPCGRYRYELRRRWRTWGKTCLFIMLNPSTADAEDDDATIRRCRAFASRWGYGGFIVVNLFGFRATNTKALRDAINPIGPDNRAHVLHAVRRVNDTYPERPGAVVCAWGNHGSYRNQDVAMRQLLLAEGVQPKCLRMTKAGQPAHPLYVPSYTMMQFMPRAPDV